MLDFLKQEMIDSEILSGIEEFRRRYPIKTTTLSRCPRYLYYGKAIWEQAAAALLCGENILLTGSKATGKMCWLRTWQPFLDALHGMSPYTSIWMPPT